MAKNGQPIMVGEQQSLGLHYFRVLQVSTAERNGRFGTCFKPRGIGGASIMVGSRPHIY